MLFNVSFTSFWSCTLAPATAAPSGTPRPSISTERFTPIFPRSVGCLPVFFPTQRRLVHRPVQTLPFPIDTLQVLVFCQSLAPQFVEHAPLYPLLKVSVNGTAGTELSRHRLPLTAGAENIQNSSHDISENKSRTTTFATFLVTW